MNNQIKDGIKSIWGCLREVYQKEGIRGIYRGALVSFVGVAIFRSTYFGIYDTFKEQTKSALERWMVSYLSVFAAISLTYPSDTVRRRMMLTSCADYKYKNFVDCAKQIWLK
jgi:solute carrier family 25 (adenine nucleotide translocator) protein 4/5/6/31